MAPMPHVDAPSATARMVFIGAFASSLAASSFLLIGDLFRSTDSSGIESVISVVELLSRDASAGGWVGLLLALVLLFPAYLALMSSVGMWQRRERFQLAGMSAAGVLAVLFISVWQWSRSERNAENDWEIGVGTFGAAIAIIALLLLWRAGMWLLDEPYRDR